MHGKRLTGGWLAVGLVFATAGAVAPGLAHAGDIVPVGAVTGAGLFTPDDNGELQRHASGLGISLAFIEPSGEFAGGFEISTLFLAGDDDERIYDLGLSFIGALSVRDGSISPFLRLGLDLSAVTGPTIDRDRQRRVTAGIHGGVGLHGFVGEDVYWRGEVGFLGAGPGGVSGQLALGWAFR